jgi:hypothetical protein
MYSEIQIHTIVKLGLYRQSGQGGFSWLLIESSFHRHFDLPNCI